MPSLNQQQFLELLGIPFTGEGCDAVADFSGIDTMTIDVTTLTPSDCIAIFECILDNGTLAQFNELLSKFDFANLSAEQCTAIAQCIVDTPAAITLITQNIDFTNLTATQVSNLNELIDFSNLSPAECTAVFQCIIDNGTPAQFTELLQKLDMSQLTAAQCVDILDCILVNGTPVQWTELLSKLDLSDLTPVQCQAVFQCILDNGTAIQYTQFLSNINFAQLSTQQCQDIFNCIILNGTTEQFTQLFNKLDFTDLSEQQCRDALQCVIDNGTPAQFNELLNIFNMANLTEAQCSDIAACIAASPNALLLIRNAILPIEASEVSVVDSGNNYTGTNVETILAEIAQRLTGVAHTTISSIDLAPTGNANEFTVSITWIDSDGNTQVTSDPTPIQVTAANVAVNYNLLTAAECQTIFQCILDNGTVAQFIELLQKLDMSQLTAVQCQAIATCITDNPAALTIINNAIDSGNVTTFSSTLSDYDLLAFPPNQPVNPPAGASSGDTLIQRYGNGYGYFTFNGTTWDLNLFDSKDNQVFTHRDETGADYVNGSLNGPQNPPANPGQGDVHAELYDNALVFFSYQAAGPGAGWDGNNITYVPLDGGVFDASTLTAAQCQTIFQCLLDNGAPAQFTELLQKFDMTDLTTAQCNALANLLISGNAGNILELGPDGKLLVNGATGTSAKTRQIDCYQSMGVSGVFEDNTDNPEIGTILYAQGIYLSGVTDLLGAMQVLVRNNGPELVDETFFFRDEDTGVVVGTSQPFNVPAGDNVITICFEPAIALSNAVEYDGDFSSAPNSNLVIPHNGTSPNGIISNETGDPAPIALLANECLNSLFTVITCTDGSQQAFDSAGASVDVAVATSGTLKASTAAAVNATGNPLIDAELSDFQSATPTTTAAGDNTVVSATSLREVLRVHNASATEVGVGADGSNQPSSVIIGNDVGTGSTGTNNVMIGAGNTGDSAQHTFSVAIGSGAGRETLGGGPYNLFMHGNSGRNSFVNNSLGIGLGALRNTGTVATPESNLIAIGNSAGRDAAGSNNTYMGFNSGNGAQGSNNFGVGPNTFRSSTGSNSVAIGQDVGNNSTATDFVAIGQNAGGAGAGLVTETVSIGHLAGTATANGLGNVAVGARALAGASAGGFGAVAVGLNAGRNADSDGSVFVGPAAGDGASGFGAVAMGSSAGAGASGQSIISIGRLAGSGASAGHLISIGQVAGQNASGSDLIGIGRFSLQNNTGSRVLALGTGAGEGNAISGAVILGHFELPRFAGPAAAATALPAAPVAGDPNPGSIYIYWDTTDNTLKVRPS